MITIVDCIDEPLVPASFRTSYQNPPGINLTGLARCRMSGSAQPSAKALGVLKGRLTAYAQGTPIVIVNLRHEPMVYIDGNVISQFAEKDWAHKDKTGPEIAEIEEAWIQEIEKGKSELKFDVIRSKQEDGSAKRTYKLHKVENKKLAREQDLVTAAEMKAKRFYVLDHCSPTEEQVTDFRQWTGSFQVQPWVHYHCHKGHGRTTTFMVMHDIYFNAPQVSFDDILTRQAVIGGIDLRSTAGEEEWKIPLIQQRLKTLEKFYWSCRPDVMHLVLCLRGGPQDSDTECE